MRHSRRRATVVGGFAAFAALLLIAEDAALLIAAAVVVGVWVRLVLLGDGQRELQRFERLWAPLLDPGDRATPSPAENPSSGAPRARGGRPGC